VLIEGELRQAAATGIRISVESCSGRMAEEASEATAIRNFIESAVGI